MDRHHDAGAPPLEELFAAFYGLAAGDIMDRRFERAAFVPPHFPVLEAVSLFCRVDHAWVTPHPEERRGVQAILVRRDLLRALEPANRSYSSFDRLRFRSLAHGSADCVCRLHEGRPLHPVTPDTPCREVLHLMEAKGVRHVPVVEADRLVGEIGAVDLLRAVERLTPAGHPTP